MKKNYTKKQIQEAINYWQGKLNEDLSQSQQQKLVEDSSLYIEHLTAMIDKLDKGEFYNKNDVIILQKFVKFGDKFISPNFGSGNLS